MLLINKLVGILTAVAVAVSMSALPDQAWALNLSDITVVAPAEGGEGLRQVTITSDIGKVTLSELARLMESDPELVAVMNERAVDSMVKPGEQVIMPSRGWLSYAVKTGDTLWDLARTYGISVEEIVAENELGLSTLLVPGQKLTIPLSGASLVMKDTGAGEPEQPAVQTTAKTVERRDFKGTHGLGETRELEKTTEPVDERDTENLPNPGQEDDTRMAGQEQNSGQIEDSSQAREVLDSLTWPLRGYITSHFGPRQERNHEGLDIAAPSGDYIRAALPGMVVFAGERGTYGNAVILRHSSGVRTLYAHASSLLVNPGEEVRPGQAIALVGSTGHSTGPHLHFEVLFNGLPLNPLEFLP